MSIIQYMIQLLMEALPQTKADIFAFVLKA